MFIRKIFAVIVILLLTTSIYASDNKSADNTKSVQDAMSTDFDVNLTTPQIKNKYKPVIVAHQKKIGERLLKQNYKVETTRQGEVLIISIPAHKLFGANETTLSELATAQLTPLISLAKDKNYKILMSMHSDNTGNQQYLDQLTHDRIIVIYEWFNENAPNHTTIVPYAMGDSEPIVPNNSSINRQANRRLEIYLIPSEQMIERAKSKTLR